MLNDIKRQFTETALRVSNLALLIVNAVHEGTECESHIIDLKHEMNSLLFMANTHNLGSAKTAVPEIVVGLRYTYPGESGRPIQTIFGVSQDAVAYAGPAGHGVMDLSEFKTAISKGRFVVVE